MKNLPINPVRASQPTAERSNSQPALNGFFASMKPAITPQQETPFKFSTSEKIYLYQINKLVMGWVR